MIIPLRTDSPLRQTPYMNWALIAANAAVFLLQLSNPLIEARYCLSPLEPHLYQFVTYAFLHGGVLHLAGNMLFLYIFGNNVNDKMGQLGYLGFYLAGAVIAGLGFILVPDQRHSIVGASGAIAAVTGAYLVLFPRSNITVLYFIYLIGQYEVPCIWFILIFFAYDIFANFAQADGVAHIAHIGGTVFGFSICFVMLLLSLLPRDQFDVLALIQRWNRRRQFRDMVSSGYNPFGASARPDRSPPSPHSEAISLLRGQIAEARSAHRLEEASQLYLQLQALEPGQVMALQTQADIANHLADAGQYPQAAQAYELLVGTYPKYEQIDQMQLMLGLIYARYLGRYDRAREYLNRALARLHDARSVQLAQAELDRIASLGGVPTPTPQPPL